MSTTSLNNQLGQSEQGASQTQIESDLQQTLDSLGHGTSTVAGAGPGNAQSTGENEQLAKKIRTDYVNGRLDAARKLQAQVDSLVAEAKLVEGMPDDTVMRMYMRGACRKLL